MTEISDNIFWILILFMCAILAYCLQDYYDNRLR
jgi:hypothetical protein